MIWKFRILYIDHYSIITIIDDSLQNCSGLLWEMRHCDIVGFQPTSKNNKQYFILTAVLFKHPNSRGNDN